MLEKIYGWRGIMVEYNNKFLPLYKEHRPNSFHVINDATLVDYRKAFEDANMPHEIDYLQIDLEVSNDSTLQTLQKMEVEVFNDYKFATVTFEHDIYTDPLNHTRIASRQIFENNGYVRVFSDINNQGVCPYEDWYVHPDLVDMTYVNRLIDQNQKLYTSHSFTVKTINWQHINYNV
jgi:hypothetical protein